MLFLDMYRANIISSVKKKQRDIIFSGLTKKLSFSADLNGYIH